MTLNQLLNGFYHQNEISKNDGVDKEAFEIDVFGLNLTFPNPELRKNIIRIHDLQYLLNKYDNSWKGKVFIVECEMPIGFWKHLPICLLSLWKMGYSLYIFSKAIFNGFKKGLNNIGIIDLNVNKSDFMKMELKDLENINQKQKKDTIGVLHWAEFLGWVLLRQIVFLLPLLILIIGFIWLM